MIRRRIVEPEKLVAKSVTEVKRRYGQHGRA
jgi:hypothetical protein